MTEVKGIDKLLSILLTDDVSDIHFKVGSPPLQRRNGVIVPSDGIGPLQPEHVNKLVEELTTPQQLEQHARGEELDIAHSLPGKARFRVNIYRQRGTAAIVMRRIPFDIPAIETLGLPAIVKRIALEQRGLVLVTGATGSGKSTTLAAMIDFINQNRQCHIVSIEDPIEFLHKDRSSSICQREVGIDTENWASALRAVFRQDPDVILIGEMRDAVSAAVALTGAETGHLVLSTLHTSDAPETINRIIDMFPSHQQRQVRTQLGGLIRAVISQRLLPSKEGRGLVLAAEVLVHTAYVQTCIIDPLKTYLIRDAIEQSGPQYGMQSFDIALLRLLAEGRITEETALAASSNPTALQLKLKGVETPSDWRM
jgi:twitching motility protein PilT